MIAPVGHACWQGRPRSACTRRSSSASGRPATVRATGRASARGSVRIGSWLATRGAAACRVGKLLDEFDMPPGRGGKLAGVVVAVAGEVEAVGGELVPLLARDLARLAADADRGVGVEAGGRMGRGSTPRRNGPIRRSTSAAAGRAADRWSACRSASSSSLLAMREPSLRAGPTPACRGSASVVGQGTAHRRPQWRRPPAGRRRPGRRTPCPRACSRCIGNQRGQIVGVAADAFRRRSPSGTASRSGGSTRPSTSERPDAARHHGAGLDPAARRPDRQPAAVDDAALAGQLGAQLDEHRRLQFVEPAS